jgi:hypothetical protein
MNVEGNHVTSCIPRKQSCISVIRSAPIGDARSESRRIHSSNGVSMNTLRQGTDILPLMYATAPSVIWRMSRSLRFVSSSTTEYPSMSIRCMSTYRNSTMNFSLVGEYAPLSTIFRRSSRDNLLTIGLASVYARAQVVFPLPGIPWRINDLLVTYRCFHCVVLLMWLQVLLLHCTREGISRTTPLVV